MSRVQEELLVIRQEGLSMERSMDQMQRRVRSADVSRNGGRAFFSRACVHVPQMGDLCSWGPAQRVHIDRL